MKINDKVKLILKDVYVYDIEACHYNIMKKMGLDVSNIDSSDKLARNTQIGKMMQRNPELTSLLRNTTTSVIDNYIFENDIKPNDIILRQYDGIIITKILSKTNLGGIPLNIKDHFLIFVSSIDRNQYIALTSNLKTVIKGVANRYEKMDDMYRRICMILNSGNKESYFRNLQRLKDYIMTVDDNHLFAVPNKNGKCYVFLKEYGQLEINNQAIDILDPDDIDREKYFNYYIVPFTKSIVVEHVK